MTLRETAFSRSLAARRVGRWVAVGPRLDPHGPAHFQVQRHRVALCSRREALQEAHCSLSRCDAVRPETIVLPRLRHLQVGASQTCRPRRMLRH